MATKQRSSRKFTVVPADNGDFLEIGPGGTSSEGGLLVIQFNPDEDFVGEFVITAKTFGPAAQDAGVPFLPVMYVPVTMDNIAAGRVLTAAPVVGASQVEVPSNGRSVALLVECSAGRCDVVSWDLGGAFTN